MSCMYEIEPLDTLFFRGSIPMEAGMQNVTSMFPPPVSVLEGAFWTSACLNKNVTDEEHRFDGVMPKVEKFFIKHDGKLYITAPATWYYDSEKKIHSTADFVDKDKKKKVISAKVIKSNDYSFTTSVGEVAFIKTENEAFQFEGCWVSVDFLNNADKVIQKGDILMNKDIYSSESRTGVALDSEKHTKEGQLYTATHIRLNDGFTMVVSLSEKPEGLGKTGKFLLGGEKRICRYTEIKDSFSNSDDSSEGLWVTTVPVKVESADFLKENLVSSGKLYVTAGWDMKKKFHKETTSWIPAGAVFNKSINNSCLKLK